MFKRRGGGDDEASTEEQATELQELIGTAREERAALSTMLTQIELQGGKLPALGRSVQSVSELAGGVAGKVDALSERLSTLDARASGIDAIDEKIESLRSEVAKATTEAGALLSPAGELQKHRQAVEQLSSQAVENVAVLDAMKKEQTELDATREQLRVSQQQLEQAAARNAALKAEFESLETVSGQVTEEHTRLKDQLRESHDEVKATTEAVKEVEQKLGPLAEIHELSQNTDTQLAKLNSLAEHVLPKVKVLENQKHTVEHAIVESNRLNELVWNMDVQVSKLNDGATQAAEVAETVQRIEALAADTVSQLAEAAKSKESFGQEVSKLQQGRAELTEFVNGYVERLSVERTQLDSFDQRVKSFQASLGTTQANIDRILAKEKSFALLEQRAGGLEARVAALAGQAGELEQQHADLETLRERLGQVDDLTARTTQQLETLEKGRAELDTARDEIKAFHAAHADVAKMATSLSADRAAFEGFLQRTDEFRRQIPVLESQMDSITSKLELVEEGGTKVAALVAVADGLDQHMTRLGGHQELLERVEARVSTLKEITSGVDERMKEQLDRRGELDSLKSLFDGLAIQALDASQHADGLEATQKTLLPMTAQVAELKDRVETTSARFADMKRDEDTIAAQEKRLTDLLEQGRAAAEAAEQRVKQVEELTAQLNAGAEMKTELAGELSSVQSQQREVIEQTEVAESQLRRVEEQVKQLDQRRTQVVFADKKISAFEGRVGELSVMSGELDRQIAALESRQALVASVKAEVDDVQQISAKSKADLQHVVEHRGEVDALRARVEEALRGIGETEERIEVIETRRSVVDDVHRKTNVIVHLLEDVRVNLEMVSEQKAVIDHVVENVATLDETLRAAQSTQRSLRVERELAERIERGIKSLRTKIGSTAAQTDDDEIVEN